jgi:MFS family permease
MTTPSVTDTSPAASSRKLTFALLLLFCINLMNFYDRNVVGAVGERIKAEWMLTDGQLAGLSTAFILLYAVVGIPLGRLADTGSRRGMLAGGVTVWSVFTALCGLAGGFGALVACRLGVGIGEASAAPAANSLIGDLFPPSRRARAISVFMLGVPAGAGASFLISGLIVQATGGWRPALFVAAAPGFLLGLLALRLPEPVRGAADPDVAVRARSAWQSIRVVLSTRTMWGIIASGALFNLIAYALSAFLTSFLIRYHGLNIDIANRFTAGIMGLGGGIGMLAGGWMGDHLGQRGARARLLLAASALCVATPLAWVALQQTRGDYWRFGLAMFCAVAAMYVYYSAVYATIHDIVEPPMRGAAMSVYFFVFYMFTALGLVGFGALSDARYAVALAGGASAADARALGLHDAFSTVPVLSVLTAAVLWIASKSADADHARVRQASPR